MIPALFVFLDLAQIVLRDAEPCGELLVRGLATELFGKRAARARQRIGAAPDPAHVALMIDHHDIAGHPHLMAVRLRIIDDDARDHDWFARIGDVNDRRTEMLRVGDVPHKSKAVADGDLARSRQIEVRDPADIVSKRGARRFDAHARRSSAMQDPAMTAIRTRWASFQAGIAKERVTRRTEYGLCCRL